MIKLNHFLAILFLFTFFTSNAQTKNTYQVMSESGYIPFAYWDENNIPTGFDIDILNAIAKVENITFEYKTIPWKVMFDSLEDGSSDIITSGISITEERKSRFTFTDPYFQSDKTILLGKDNAHIRNIDELKDLKVGVKESSTSEKVIKGLGFNNVFPEKTTFLAIKKVITKQNDAAVSDFGVIKYYQKRYKDLNYLVIPNSTVEFGFGVKKGNHVLAEILNRGLKTIKDNGIYDKIYQKYFMD